MTVEIAPGTDDWEARGRTVRLSDHFAKVCARYRTLRELDFEAVRIISDVVARAVDPGRPVRLVDVATGSRAVPGTRSIIARAQFLPCRSFPLAWI